MKAQPGPMVSGSHFFPKAPLLWVKWMPAWAVMSRKVTCARAASAEASRKDNTHHGDTLRRRSGQAPARRKALLAVSFWLLARSQRLKAKGRFCSSAVDLLLK